MYRDIINYYLHVALFGLVKHHGAELAWDDAEVRYNDSRDCLFTSWSIAMHLKNSPIQDC